MIINTVSTMIRISRNFLQNIFFVCFLDEVEKFKNIHFGKLFHERRTQIKKKKSTNERTFEHSSGRKGVFLRNFSTDLHIPSLEEAGCEIEMSSAN